MWLDPAHCGWYHHLDSAQNCIGQEKASKLADWIPSFPSELHVAVMWAAALTSSKWGNVTWDCKPKKLSPLLKCFDRSVVSQQQKLSWKHLFWYKYLFTRVLLIFSSLLEMKCHRAYEASSLPLSCTSSSDAVFVRTFFLNQRILKTQLFLLMYLLKLPRHYSLLGSVDISCKLASPVCLVISFQTFRSTTCRWSTHEWMELNVEDITLIWKANHSIR